MKPNILLIMSDQHHKRILGCAGDALAHTPHLDALAAWGTRRFNAWFEPVRPPRRGS
ncbi:MAG: hypothetical protein M5U26_16075 [Planctomycetota bacterium]|nr:hypothetical protein [Planctomycetota bacterium]